MWIKGNVYLIPRTWVACHPATTLADVWRYGFRRLEGAGTVEEAWT